MGGISVQRSTACQEVWARVRVRAGCRGVLQEGERGRRRFRNEIRHRRIVRQTHVNTVHAFCPHRRQLSGRLKASRCSVACDIPSHGRELPPPPCPPAGAAAGLGGWPAAPEAFSDFLFVAPFTLHYSITHFLFQIILLIQYPAVPRLFTARHILRIICNLFPSTMCSSSVCVRSFLSF